MCKTMEAFKKRDQFYSNLKFLKQKFQLTDTFLNQLANDSYFTKYENAIKEFKNDNESKLFILLEFTREKSTCEALIRILRDCGQNEVAQSLGTLLMQSTPIVKSFDSIKINTEVEIEVCKVFQPVPNLPNAYILRKSPRGKCIIINNVEEQQYPDVYDHLRNRVLIPKGLKRETIRFEDVFTQLYFDVEVINNLSAEDMQKQLNQISKDKSLENDEAFVTIVISRGHHNCVFGYNACEVMRKIRFNEIENNYSDMSDANQQIQRDCIKIKDIIDIFSEDNCPQMKSKPKLFFFVCCTHTSLNQIQNNKHNYNNDPGIKYDIFEEKNDIKEKDGNENTFVSYSSANELHSFYDFKYGLSYFNVAFTQSIAINACTEPLSTIMNKTLKRLKEMFDNLNAKECTEKQSISPCSNSGIERYAVEVNIYPMNRQLFFNPGYKDN